MAPIPPFPALRRLAIDDRAAVEAVTRRFPPSSDFSFTSLWCWDTAESCAISLLDGNLVVRLKGYAGDGHFYSFLGDRAVAATARTLLAHARREGLPGELRLVPEAVVGDARLSRQFSVAEDRDNFDYVYALDDWVALAGGPFRHHRWRIARCRRRAAIEVRPIDLQDSDVQAAMIELFDRWMAQKPASEADEHRQEQAALGRSFALAEADDRLSACGAYDGARLVGFSVWEGLPGSDHAIGHFLKTDRAYDGLASYLRHAEAGFVRERGYALMNVEQDLGLPGLRASKLALRPCRFLRKYVIAPRSSAGNGHGGALDREWGDRTDGERVC